MKFKKIISITAIALFLFSILAASSFAAAPTSPLPPSCTYQCPSAANANQQCSSYQCGSAECKPNKVPPAGHDTCEFSCPDPAGDCVVCVSSSCGGGCANKDPSLNYNKNCAASFDWAKGKLKDIPPDEILKNLNKIGGRLSDLTPEQKKAIIDKIIADNPLLKGGINLDKCYNNEANQNDPGNNACEIVVGADGKVTKLKSGKAELDLSKLNLPEGASVTAIRKDNCVGKDNCGAWEFTIPPKDQKCLGLPVQPVSDTDRCEQPIIFGDFKVGSPSGGTVTWDGDKFTLSPDSYVIYTDPTANTRTTVYARKDGGDVDVYIHGDVPTGASGVSINGPRSNGDGVYIRGVDVVVAHQTKNSDGIYETIGVMTDEMKGTSNEATLKRNPNGSYDLDLTKAGNSQVKFMEGLEGFAYQGNNPNSQLRNNMYGCNEATGSCPYDTKTNLKLHVTYYESDCLLANGNPKPGCAPKQLDITGQDGYSNCGLLPNGQPRPGCSVQTCPCDKTVPCDKRCPANDPNCKTPTVSCECDMICGLEGVPEWLWVTLGYGNYLKCTRPPSGIQCFGGSDCCSAYTYPERAGHEKTVTAFKNRRDSCKPSDFDNACFVMEGGCRKADERPCTRCFDTMNCEDSPDLYCDKHCGYCNQYFSLDLREGELFFEAGQPIKVNITDIITDEYKNTVTPTILKQKNPESLRGLDPSLTECSIVDDFCSNIDPDTLEPINLYAISCPKFYYPVTIELDLRLTDECGWSRAADPDDIYPINPLFITIIVPQTKEDRAKLWSPLKRYGRDDTFITNCPTSE